jgi:2'-5' RNA ligase
MVMSEIKPADHQPNDQFGYACYAVVIPASPEIVEKCQRIEQASGMTRAKAAAHITVKGTFHSIASLDSVKSIIRSITADTPPFQIYFEGAISRWGEDGGYLSVPVTSDMQTLHNALVAALTSLAIQAYRDDPYHAHMTYVQDTQADGLNRAKSVVVETDWGEGIPVAHIDLIGRIGQAYGGRWTLIESFSLYG